MTNTTVCIVLGPTLLIVTGVNTTEYRRVIQLVSCLSQRSTQPEYFILFPRIEIIKYAGMMEGLPCPVICRELLH